MNRTSLKTDEIHLTHKTDRTNNSIINIISESAIGINKPLHVKEYIIDDKFKMIVESNDLVIQKKIDGVFTNYFKLS